MKMTIKRTARRLLILSMVVVLGAAFSLPLSSSSLFGTNKSSKVSAAANGFQAGHIIDNNIFTNSNALSVGQIQTFLNDMVGSCYAPNAKSTNPGNGSCINQYVENISNLTNNFSNPNASIPGGISAAQIIYSAAQQYSINPEVLLVTLQKEQGLVTDNWPFYSEYQYAMGYACPDSSPGCNGSYADFYKQVDGAAWQFRYYLDHPGAFNYWLGANTIAYAPGCGGSTVNIQNAATAALYIYTPYQPDSNVLNYTNPIGSSSGPGPAINDSCGAYGNRNFWWYFNTWFGSSVNTSVSLAEESGGSTFYVLYDGQKQGIPSVDVLNAWGLNGLPVATLDPSVFNSIPTASTALTRYALLTKTGQTFFADNGNSYYVSPSDASAWGNFPGQTQSNISDTLVNFSSYQGELKPFVATSGNSNFYVIDNGVLHAFPSASLYNTWAGQNNPPDQISSAYFNTLTQSQTAITSPEFTYAGTTYVVSDREIFSLTNNTTGLMPGGWNNLPIGFGLANSFVNGGPLNYKVQVLGSPAVYMLDSNGIIRGIPDPQTNNAFQIDSSGDTTTLSADLMSFFTVGAPITSNIATIGGQSYVVNGGLQSIPTNLTAAYNPGTTGITLNSAYQSIFPTLGAATALAQSAAGSPAIYFLDGGRLLPFSNPNTLSLVGGGSAVTRLTDGTLGKFSGGPIMQDYVTNGTTNYLLDRGKTFTVPSAQVSTAWNLGPPVSISTGSAANFPSGGTLSQYIQIPNGQLCLVDAVAYCAGQAPLVTMWNLQSALIKPSQQSLSAHALYNVPLSPFVGGKPGQAYAGTIFTVANGQLIGIPSMNAAFNLGIGNWPVITLNASTISSLLSGQVWQGYLANDSNNTTWVLDGGAKRALSSNYRSAWVGSNTPTTLGSDYLSLMPTSPAIGNSIKSYTNPTIFGIQSGQRYGFTSLQSYNAASLSASTTVGDSLVQSIPSGGIWP